MYEMNGTQVIGSATIGGGGGWNVVATGDFNGDSKSDILWQNSNTGSVLMYEMNGTQVAANAVIGGGGGWSPFSNGLTDPGDGVGSFGQMPNNGSAATTAGAASARAG